jgi:hypothetical protein
VPEFIGSVGTTDAASSYADLDGEVGRSFRLRALSGATVTIASAVDLKLISWASSIRFTLNGAEYGFQAGPRPMALAAVLPFPGFSYSGELSVAGGTLFLGEVSSDLRRLTPEQRDALERSLDLSAEDRAYYRSRTAPDASASSWVGYWTDGRYDLLLIGADWHDAERQSLHQLSAFTIDVAETGIAVRPVKGRRVSVYGVRVSAIVSPLGGIDILPRAEARRLLPDGEPSLPLAHGALRRVVTPQPDAGLRGESLLYSNRTAIGLIRDPRLASLDQPDRLAAIQDLELSWH